MFLATGSISNACYCNFVYILRVSFGFNIDFKLHIMPHFVYVINTCDMSWYLNFYQCCVLSLTFKLLSVLWRVIDMYASLSGVTCHWHLHISQWCNVTLTFKCLLVLWNVIENLTSLSGVTCHWHLNDSRWCYLYLTFQRLSVF